MHHGMHWWRGRRVECAGNLLHLPRKRLPACTPASTSAVALVAEETPAVSLDGRYVAYTAVQNDHAQIFLRDTCEGAPAGCQPRTTLLSAAADASPANEDSRTP